METCWFAYIEIRLAAKKVTDRLILLQLFIGRSFTLIGLFMSWTFKYYFLFAVFNQQN